MNNSRRGAARVLQVFHPVFIGRRQTAARDRWIDPVFFPAVFAARAWRWLTEPGFLLGYRLFRSGRRDRGMRILCVLVVIVEVGVTWLERSLVSWKVAADDADSSASSAACPPVPGPRTRR